MRNPFCFSCKEAGAVMLLSFAVAGAVVAFTDRSAALSPAAERTVTVNRTNQGDRLPLAVPPPPRQSSIGVAPIRANASKHIPLGCEPAFSPYADPAGAHVFLRCLS
jgi:hypothetical protein